MARCQLANEVVFVTQSGQLEIRLADQTTNMICKAARDLKARYFVAVDGWRAMEGDYVWGVFDMRDAQGNNPYPGQWSTGAPVKTFPFEAKDAAVMYALTMAGRRN